MITLILTTIAYSVIPPFCIAICCLYSGFSVAAMIQNRAPYNHKEDL